MKRLLLIAATALVASGCVSDSPLFVTGIFPMDAECTANPPETLLGSGNLDLSGSGSYLFIVDLKNDLDIALDTKADTAILATGAHRNTVNIDSVSVTYTTVPASIVLEAEVTPITIVMAPQKTVHVGMSLFGPKATEKLGLALANAGDRVDVRAKFEFRGNIVSGGKVTSSPISFPVSVIRSGFTCPIGETPVRTGSCGRIGGQDNARLCCSGDASCVVK